MRRVLAAALVLAGVLIVAGSASADEVEDPFGYACLSPQGEAECSTVAGSGTGNASSFVAVSGSGGADGGVAASGTGDASAFVAASGTGKASGIVALAGTGDATGFVPVSVLGGCRQEASETYRPCVDAANGRSVEGYWAGASLTGDASCTAHPCAAISVWGNASGTVAASLSGQAEGDVAAEGCTPHPTVEITEDEGPQGFILERTPTGQPVYRPGSGVVAGNGTAEDPYVIGPWCIPTAGTAIRLSGTDAHVRIVGNLVDPELAGERSVRRGIEILDAANVTVEANTIRAAALGIHVRGGEEIDLSHNRIEEGSVLGGRAYEGVLVVQSQAVTVEANGLADVTFPFRVRGTDDVRFVDNDVVTLPVLGKPSIEIKQASGVHLEGNRFLTPNANPFVGERVFVEDAVEVRVLANELNEGLELVRSQHVEVRDNEMWGPLALSATPGTLVADNEIGRGLVIDGGTRADFEHVVEGNTVAGQPLFYVRGADEVQVPEVVGQVVLVDVQEARVADRTLDDLSVAVQAAYSGNVTLRNLAVHGSTFGVDARTVDQLEVTSSSIEDTWTAVRVRGEGQEARFSGNKIEDASVTGIGVQGIERVLVEDNAIRDIGYWVFGEAVSIQTATDAHLTGNAIDDALVAGASLEAVGSVDVANNTVQRSGAGVRLDAVAEGSVTHNNVTANDVGIEAHGSTAVGVHENNVWANEGPGALASTDEQLDARENWWGCPEGPSHEDCDDAEGSLSVDPWLTEPVATAGAG